MVPEQQNVCPQNPIFTLDDGLLCDEQEKDLDFGCGFGFLGNEHQGFHDDEKINKDPPFSQLEQDLGWDEDELSSLLSKEKIAYLGDRDLICDRVLMVARKEAVDWMIRVSSHYGFVAMTTTLAVNYFDRFVFSPCFQKDKPWMTQLAAVACLSLASKVEEIQAPLLLDLQVEGSKFVFESKTIMRMELLVLSSLQWKMNPVTPLSFFDYIMRRLKLISHHLHWEFLWRCEQIALSVISDSKFLGYLPSVIATGTMCLVIKDVEPANALGYENQLKDVLKISEEDVDNCTKFIMEVSERHGTIHSLAHKRKYHSIPGSPNGVIDAYFSSDNSNDSWTMASSVSSSPEPLFKKSRAQDQQMRLAPVNRVSISVLDNPH